MKKITIAQVLSTLVIITSGTVFGQTEVPHEFQSGEPARAAEVNENFSTLETAVDDNTADINANSAANQDNSDAISILANQSLVQISEIAVTIGSTDTTLEINGVNFDSGTLPEVTLAGVPATVSSSTSTTIIAEVLTASFPAGDYLLALSTDQGMDEYDLTIGGVGPTGEDGPDLTSELCLLYQLTNNTPPQSLACVIGQCLVDEQCVEGSWCRQTENDPLEKECVLFAQEGDFCGGFTVPWAASQCAPDLVCADETPFVVDDPGVCRLPPPPECAVAGEIEFRDCPNGLSFRTCLADLTWGPFSGGICGVPP